MIIETHNSVYRLYQDGKRVVIEKTEDKIARDSYVPTGIRFDDTAIPPIILGNRAVVGKLITSKVIKVTPEEGDENICFTR